MAAIYARKSTAKTASPISGSRSHSRSDHARRHAERKGWTAADNHVYVDDGIPGRSSRTDPV